MAKSLTYKDAGVDLEAAEKMNREIARHLRRTFGPQVLENVGGFAGLFSLDKEAALFTKDYRHPVLAACSDGVGTKLKLAFETGRHRTVGIDAVAMNVNDLLAQGAEPLFFLDYIGTGKLKPGVLAEVVAGVADGCVEARCALLGGETAEMPDFYSKGEYDLAGFVVGVVEKDKVIDGRRTSPGDKVIGIASSGLHSNGFSLVRKIFFKEAKMKPGDYVDELETTLGDELLRPTRIYARAIRGLLARYKVKKVVRGIAHITGGGMPGNIPRILPERLSVEIKKGTWPIPPIFGLVERMGNVDEEEMYRVFNMGIGMVVIVAPYYANGVVKKLKRLREKAFVIGRVRRGRREVRII